MSLGQFALLGFRDRAAELLGRLYPLVHHDGDVVQRVPVRSSIGSAPGQLGHFRDEYAWSASLQ